MRGARAVAAVSRGRRLLCGKRVDARRFWRAQPFDRAVRVTKDSAMLHPIASRSRRRRKKKSARRTACARPGGAPKTREDDDVARRLRTGLDHAPHSNYLAIWFFSCPLF